MSTGKITGTTKILIVDDEPQMRRVLRSALSSHGYDVVDARSGEEALRNLEAERFDFILLDLNLPGLGGLPTCRAIRAGGEVPIIVVSVRTSERDKVNALEAGADDYVTKPFGIQELLARIRAVQRRKPGGERPSQLVLKEVTIDFESHRVTGPGREERLTPKEFELLRYLVSHAGQVVPHRRLLQAVWGPDYGEEVEYLRVFVNQLRRKIELDTQNPQYLLTEPWAGYRFVLPA
jgi:two-component system, OmpR family, KDP operon response regulator KdpE